MNLGTDGLSGLGAFPQPTTDALAASWCTAKGIPPAFCSIAPGSIDPSGSVHIVSDPSGQPCTPDYYAPDGSLNPCTFNSNLGIGIPPGWLESLGKSIPNTMSCSPAEQQSFGGQLYNPISCGGTTLLTQAQILALLALQPGASSAPPAQSVQNVYADPVTAQAVASQIVGASVQPTADGQYAVVAPGYAVATPAVIAQISSQPAPAGSSGSVPITTPPASGGSIPPAGNSQAAPPSSNMWCFPGDTSAEIMPNVPVCQNTALAALGALLVLVLVLK